MTRSTTNEMLAARHDKEPYLCEDGTRISVALFEQLGHTERYWYDFAPRVECIPSPERYWVLDLEPGQRRQNPDDTVALVDESLGGYERTFATFEDAHAAMRALRPEPNPILVAFRGWVENPERREDYAINGGNIIRDEADWWLSDDTLTVWGDDKLATPEQIADARKVLTRLANFSVVAHV